MELESVLALKEDVLERAAQHYQQSRDDYANLAQGLLDQRPEKRLAVGYSMFGPGDYRLELRVYREAKFAHRLAEEIVAEAKGEANIEIIPQVRVTARRDTSPPATPVVSAPGPLELGMSIGHPDGETGTLGAFVSIKDDVHVLSCCHVIALNGRAKAGPKGDSIYHPGAYDASILTAEHRIGHLANYSELVRATANQTEVAVACLDTDLWRYTGNTVPASCGSPDAGRSLTLMDDPLSELDYDIMVCKVGRSTGYTEGRLRAIAIDGLTISFTNGRNYVFDNVIEIRSENGKQPFALSGDSGSVVYKKDGLAAFGILFAGGTRADNVQVNYCCDLKTGLDAMRAEFLD